MGKLPALAVLDPYSSTIACWDFIPSIPSIGGIGEKGLASNGSGPIDFFVMIGAGGPFLDNFLANPFGLLPNPPNPGLGRPIPANVLELAEPVGTAEEGGEYARRDLISSVR
jgi:hypothetical protein